MKQSILAVATVALAALVCGAQAQQSESPAPPPAAPKPPAAVSAAAPRYPAPAVAPVSAGWASADSVNAPAASPLALPRPIGGRFRGLSARGGQAGTLVLSLEADPQSKADLTEDLSVMSHLLDKTLNERFAMHAPVTQAMGIEVLFGQGTRRVENLYIEDHGALFLLSVGFPLAGPAQRAEKKEPSTPASSTWEAARRELFGPSSQPGQIPMGEEYSADKVAQLEKAMLEVLKNGANIRGLKPEEFITVCILGGSTPGGRSAPGAGAHTRVADSYALAVGAPGPQPGTMMTIRAKKSDIDAFSGGDINLDQFASRARVRTGMSGFTAEDGPGAQLNWGGLGIGGSGGGFGTGGGGFGGGQPGARSSGESRGGNVRF